MTEYSVRQPSYAAKSHCDVFTKIWTHRPKTKKIIFFAMTLFV